ncbi:MAG: ABC transporter ATP-binding protein [Thermodesulfovibrionales bacterium]|nr:ABC transporter ATP-binding protein [Thermodesulfovibrionales bacterium]
MNMIKIEDLKVEYNGRMVLENLNLDFDKSGITSIIGPNGSGKSTLLKVIGRLIKQSGGCVYLDGKDIHSLPTKVVARKMAILPQSPRSPDDITVKDLVGYGRAPYQGMIKNSDSEGKEIIDWAIDVCDIRDFADRYVNTLSGGERQRAWIAMALAQKTKVLLLDEPTTFLDIHHQLEVLELLERLHTEERITIIMVIHDINHAARFSKRIIAVKGGCIIKDGVPQRVLTENLVRRLFDIRAKVINIDKECGNFSLYCIPYSVDRD